VSSHDAHDPYRASHLDDPRSGTEMCMSDLEQTPHEALHPSEDVDLQIVHAWLMSHPVESLLTGAVDDAIQYVLDGARTWRFDLNSNEVDSDERRTVGTKLQYRIIAAFGLVKEAPLDTSILGIPVELKATVGGNWMIPREGQCQMCLLVQVDTRNDRHRAFLMRPHRIWLNRGNQDKKRTITKASLDQYAVPLIAWTPLPTNPLKLLTEDQRKVVFDLKQGQAKRLTALFGFLPDTVVPRTAILTVCANRLDPLRRARQIKQLVRDEHGLTVLCGKWDADRAEALSRGFDLSGSAWVALRPDEQAPNSSEV
jgi:hypothetical protein